MEAMYGAPKCSGINVVVHQVKDLPLFYPYGRPAGNTGNIKNLQGHNFIVVFHYSKDLEKKNYEDMSTD